MSINVGDGGVNVNTLMDVSPCPVYPAGKSFIIMNGGCTKSMNKLSHGVFADLRRGVHRSATHAEVKSHASMDSARQAFSMVLFG